MPWTKNLSRISDNSPLATLALISKLAFWNNNPAVNVSVAQIKTEIASSITGFRGVASETTLGSSACGFTLNRVRLLDKSAYSGSLAASLGNLRTLVHP